MNTHCKPHHAEHLLQKAGTQQAMKAVTAPEESQTLALYGGQMPLGGSILNPSQHFKKGFLK